MVTRNSQSRSATFWRYAPGARAGLLVSVLGIAALAVTNQIVTERSAAGESTQALSAGAAVIGVLVVAYVARSVPLGVTYMRQDVGACFASVVYAIAVITAVVAVLVRQVWLTGVCVGVLVLLAGIVLARRVPPQSERH